MRRITQSDVRRMVQQQMPKVQQQIRAELPKVAQAMKNELRKHPALNTPEARRAIDEGVRDAARKI